MGLMANLGVTVPQPEPDRGRRKTDSDTHHKSSHGGETFRDPAPKKERDDDHRDIRGDDGTRANHNAHTMAGPLREDLGTHASFLYAFANPSHSEKTSFSCLPSAGTSTQNSSGPEFVV